MRKFFAVPAASALAVVLAAAAPAWAGPMTFPLGGGWQVTIFEPDFLQIETIEVNVDEDRLNIRKTATFSGLDEITGAPKPLQATFEQIAPDDETVSRILIDEEFITNMTGVDWDAFRIAVQDSGRVSFDQAGSASFSFDPFTVRTYNGDSTEVEFSGGIVPDGGTWTPGVDSGALVIQVDLDDPNPALFTLKETPIPEPASFLLLGLAAFALRRR